jgi:hypothetical protein
MIYVIIILKATSFDKIYHNIFKNIKPEKLFFNLCAKISDLLSGHKVLKPNYRSLNEYHINPRYIKKLKFQ